MTGTGGSVAARASTSRTRSALHNPATGRFHVMLHLGLIIHSGILTRPTWPLYISSSRHHDTTIAERKTDKAYECRAMTCSGR